MTDFSRSIVFRSGVKKLSYWASLYNNAIIRLRLFMKRDLRRNIIIITERDFAPEES